MTMNTEDRRERKTARRKLDHLKQSSTHLGRQIEEVGTAVEFLGELQTTLDQIDDALAPIIADFRARVLNLEGQSYGTLEVNQSIANAVQEVADQLRVAFSCPKCGEPARFRCSAAATAKTGMFVFSHGRQTHGGGTKMPKLVVVAAPENGRKSEIPKAGA